jgi:hypothetical protein
MKTEAMTSDPVLSARKHPAPTATRPVKISPKLARSHRPLSAFDVFLRCIERADNLITIHKNAHGIAARPADYLSDAFRASLVLSISALDAFVRAHVLERIAKLIRDKTKSIPAPLAVEIRRFLKDEELLQAALQDDLVQRVEKAFKTDFDRKSFQGVRNISDAMKIIGHDDVFHTIAVNASKNEDNLKQQLNDFTQRRHWIAHQGDYDLTQNPATQRQITKSDAERCIRLVTIVAKEINKL